MILAPASSAPTGNAHPSPNGCAISAVLPPLAYQEGSSYA
jgi:hypothetical protein